MQPVQDLTIDATVSRTQYQFVLEDAEPDELDAWVAEAGRAAAAAARSSTTSPATSQQQGLSAYIDDRPRHRRRASASPPATVDNALYDAFGQRIVSTIFTQSNQYRVILEADPALQTLARLAERDLSAVVASGGGQVPLSAIAARRRSSRRRCRSTISASSRPTTISFNLAPGVSLGAAVDAIRAGRAGHRHAGERHHHLPGRGARPSRPRSSNELLLILAAIVTVYIVLGVLYESFIHPVTILSTLPSAGIGALLALMIAGSDLGVIGIIGIILLIGIVKKNAIMMIDFALDAERDEGKPPREAIHQACLLRFRPILMTTMAALLGALPLMLGTRHRLGAAPPARHHHRRRPDRQPGADAVHHAGDLSGVRPPGARGCASPRAPRRRRRRERPADEPLRALHPPAGRAPRC